MTRLDEVGVLTATPSPRRRARRGGGTEAVAEERVRCHHADDAHRDAPAWPREPVGKAG